MSADGTVWIATAAGVLEWRDEIVRSLTARDGLPDDVVFALHEDRGGRLWIGTRRGLAVLDPDSPRKVTEAAGAGTRPIHAIFEDSLGALWLGAPGRVIMRSVDGGFHEYGVGNLRDPDTGAVTAFVEDPLRQIWFGAQDAHGGLYRLARTQVTTIVRQDGLPCDNVGVITEAADGTLWVGPYCGEARGLVAIRNGQIRFHPGPSWVASLLAESDSTLWAGLVDGRLFRIEDGRFAEAPAPTPSAGDEITAIYRHRDGALWLGTNRGLVTREHGGWKRFQVGDGLDAPCHCTRRCAFPPPRRRASRRATPRVCRQAHSGLAWTLA